MVRVHCVGSAGLAAQNVWPSSSLPKLISAPTLPGLTCRDGRLCMVSARLPEWDKLYAVEYFAQRSPEVVTGEVATRDTKITKRKTVMLSILSLINHGSYV